MTRIAYVKKMARNLKKKDIIGYLCPSVFGCGPSCDEETVMVDDSGKTIGCGGLFCEECWAEEVEE